MDKCLLALAMTVAGRMVTNRGSAESTAPMVYDWKKRVMGTDTVAEGPQHYPCQVKKVPTCSVNLILILQPRTRLSKDSGQ